MDRRRALKTVAMSTAAVGATVAAVGLGTGGRLPVALPGHRDGAGGGADRFDDPYPPLLGVHFHGTWSMYYDSADRAVAAPMFTVHLDRLAEQGVGLLRVDVGWSTSQPDETTPSLDHYYNQRVAAVLDAAAARDMRVLLVVHQSPPWSRPDTGDDPRQFPTDPRTIRAWATWMAGTFGPRVFAWEIWNEPNLREFTGVRDPAERPVRYVPLLREAAEGLWAGHPDAVVVFGGPSKTDDAFIRACYALGAAPYFDVMSLHPYQGDQTKPPESTDVDSPERMTHLPAVLTVMEEFGDGDKPVWWTEFGFSVHSNDDVPPDEPWRRGVENAAISAEYLVRSFELARTKYPPVRVAIPYTAYRPPSDPVGHQHGYRLLERDGTVRPQLPTLRGYHFAHGRSRLPF